MSLRAIPARVWFVAALVPMVASQIVRLQQSDPATWMFWDYAGDRWVDSVSRYSFRADGCVPVAATPDGCVGSCFVDRRFGPR